MVTRFVDTESALCDAVAAIERCAEVAFDAEGVNLGRHGPLTIATFSGIGMEDTYIVDVQGNQTGLC